MNNKQDRKIIAIAATTIDGKIARHSGQFTDWTSPEDKDVLHKHLDRSDVVIVGNNTHKTAEAALSKRNRIVFTRSVDTTERSGENLLYYNPAVTALATVLGRYRSIALLGGTQIYTYFLERDLIDEIYLTIEPVIFGSGLDLFSRPEDITTRFELISFEGLNEQGSLLLHYQRLTRVRT